MKKLLLLSLVLGACATTTEEPVTGITRLNQEPKDCKYIYDLGTTMKSYNLKDAYEFMEKEIIERDLGDSYYVLDEKILDNKDAVFGPKNTFKIKARVYNCKK